MSTLATEWEEVPGCEAGVIPDAATCGSVAQWFAKKFPALPEQDYGVAVLEETTKGGKKIVTDISQPYLAATLSEKGTPDAPTIYMAVENRFYTYSPVEGIYVQTREPEILTRLSSLLLQAAQENPGAITKKLEFGFRDSSNLAGVIKHAQGLLVKPHDYFDGGLTECIPCRNGMLRLRDNNLLAFQFGLPAAK